MKLLKNSRLFFAVLVLMISVVFTLNRSYNSILKEQIKQQKNEFYIAKNEFEAKMNNSIIFVYGLSGFSYSQIEEGLTQKDFIEFAKDTQRRVSYIKNFSIAIDYIQTFVYPLEGNKSTLGHNLIKDPRSEVVNDVKKAINSGKIVISGPYQLRQGGLGMVVRSPILSKKLKLKYL